MDQIKRVRDLKVGDEGYVPCRSMYIDHWGNYWVRGDEPVAEFSVHKDELFIRVEEDSLSVAVYAGPDSVDYIYFKGPLERHEGADRRVMRMIGW